MTITWADLTYPVRLISQFMSKPIVEQLQCTHRILRYASGTTYHGLLYRAGIAEQLVYYTEVDWARNVDDHQSTFGYAFSLGSAVVTWCSKKQSIVALSSTEAEYRGEVVATCEAIGLKRPLKALQVEVSDPMTVYWDNLSIIQLMKNPVFTLEPSTLRCTIISGASVSSLVKWNFSTFRLIDRWMTSSPNLFA